jgi:hypothetical protein
MKKTSKMPIILLVVSLVALLAGGGTLIYLSTQGGGNENKQEVNNTVVEEKLAELTIEVGDKTPTAKDYNYSEDATIEYTNLPTKEVEEVEIVTEVGTYTGTITEKEETFEVTLKVEDTTAPELTLKEVSINENDKYSANQFVESKKDNSDKEIEISFESEEMAKYKTAGEYSIKIIAKDKAGNETAKETKLVITKKEEKKESTNTNTNSNTNSSTKSNTKKNISSNTSSNSNNTNTNNTSNNNQTTKPTSTPEQPKTEESKPQNLYYGALAPKGTANPTYMLDASDATYNAIARDSQNVAFMRGQVPDGPGGRSVSIDIHPEAWSKTKDYMNPDGYTYIGYIFITSGDPAWNDTSIQYKGYGSNRIIAEFYWTNKNGSKAWKWNPNGFHF